MRIGAVPVRRLLILGGLLIAGWIFGCATAARRTFHGHRSPQVRCGGRASGGRRVRSGPAARIGSARRGRGSPGHPCRRGRKRA
ncbi:hypothetical protein [Actinomadura sp. KC345]|uniref:hypothetical protein n=1 Tax=Actinomadura sp. KC345 TaxID=2530371 RepID=UPI001A9E9F2A|nr:hypothetical protein [Actinomadura sp. KC345]